MKTKIIFTIVFIIILSSATAFLVFLTKKGSSIGPASVIPQSNEATEKSTTTPPVQPPQKVSVDTDYFAITMPTGWESSSEANVLPIIIADSKEQVIDEKAKEIDFRTNLSINRAPLGENSLIDYVEALKAGLSSLIPIMEITKEEVAEIDSREAYLMEIESIQQDLKFYTLVALAVDKENTVWAFSFNTLKESWLKYKEIFYETIEGIKFK